MIVVRGVNVYPGQIDEVLSRHDGLGSEYQLCLERRDDGRDYLTVRVEREETADPGGDGDRRTGVESDLHRSLLVRADVEVVTS